jgi:peptide-methionine (S)-S-oxide reductase
MVLTSKVLALGAGCYWGTEKYVVKDFQNRFPNTIKSAAVGFMSPHADAPKDPSYRAVCSGTTGHVEVLYVELNEPSEEVFTELIRFFFMFHDPTTKNRQGNDAGTQYASWIFCGDDKQLEIAEGVKAELQQAVAKGKVKAYTATTVSTDVGPAREFYAAHEEHQAYLEKNPLGYCNHRYRFKSWDELN